MTQSRVKDLTPATRSR